MFFERSMLCVLLSIVSEAFKKLPRGKNEADCEWVGKKIRPSCAPNEVTTLTAGGRHGAADSFDLVEAHITKLYCMRPRERREGARRAVGSFKGGVFHLCQTPFGRARRPRKVFSRALYAAATPPSASSTRGRRVCIHIRVIARYRVHEEKRERERKNDTTKEPKELL